MSDDAAMLREIARLTSSINDFKRQGGTYAPARGRGRGRARGRGAIASYAPGPSYGPVRGSAYSRGHFGPRGGSFRGGARGGVRGGARGAHGGARGGAAYSYQAPQIKYNTPCTDFTSTGKCTHGLSCRYQHIEGRVALCKSALHGRQCVDVLCTLSHTPDEHNTPVCTHFTRGHCTRDDCRFTHMTCLAGSTEICPTFSLEGWCDHGAKCTKLHLFECPEFAKSGKCTRTACKLQHTHRAHTQPVATPEPAGPAPHTQQKINVSMLLDDIDSSDDDDDDDGDASDDDASDGPDKPKLTQEPKVQEDHPSDEHESGDALDPSDFDGAHVDLNDDDGSFIHI